MLTNSYCNAYLHDQCMDFHQNSPAQNRDSRFVVGERNCRVVNIPRYLSALWSEISLSTASLRANFPLGKKNYHRIFHIATCRNTDKSMERGRRDRSLTNAGVDSWIRGNYIDYLQSSFPADLVLSRFPYFLIVFRPYDLRSDNEIALVVILPDSRSYTDRHFVPVLTCQTFELDSEFW